MASPATSKATSSFDILRYRGAGSYRTVSSEILAALCKSVDKDILEQIQVQLMCKYPHVCQEILSKTELIEIYHLILKENKSNFKELTLYMIEAVQKHVYDLFDLKDKLRNFTLRITQEAEDVHIGEERNILGRKKESIVLYNLIMEARHIKLVNVWGIPGIGKSYLVKHLASRLFNEGEFDIIYVNARSVVSVSDLLTKTLLRLQLAGTGIPSEAELLGTLLMYLESNRKESFLLIFDDLSNLMVTEEKSSEILLLLNQILAFTKKAKIGIHIVVTSSNSFLSGSGDVPTEMAACTVEVPLGKLSEEDSDDVINLYPLVIEDPQKVSLLRAACGHPHTLHMLGTLASVDFKLTEEIIASTNGDLINRLLSEGFIRLPVNQRKVLLAVGLFDGDASLGEVCEITQRFEDTADIQQVKDKFCEQVLKEFNNGFWLTYRTCDQKVESSHKTIVAPYHPVIGQFLRNMIKSYEEGEKSQKDTIRMIKEAFINYHLEVLISVASKCLDNRMESCETLMKRKPNLRRMMVLISESADPPSILFGKRQQASGVCGGLKGDGELVNIFICLHEYHQCFDDCLLTLLDSMVKSISDTKDCRPRVLLMTLYVLILTVKNNWAMLESVILQMERDKDTPERIKTQKSLYYFCEAIYCYAKGRLQTFLKIPATELFVKARKALRKFHLDVTSPSKSLGTSRSCDIAEMCRKYFGVHILLAHASSVFSANPDTSVQEAYRLCKDANKYASKVTFLTPIVYAELARYKSIEASRSDKNVIVQAAYGMAFSYYKMMNSSNSLGLDHSNGLARMRLSYSQALLSFVQFFDTRQQIKKPISPEIMGKLEQAKDECKVAVGTMKRNSVRSKSAEDLLRCYEHLGSCYYRFADIYHRSKDPSKEDEAKIQAARNYQRVYNLIHRQPHSCNLPDNKAVVERVLERLPSLLPMPSRATVDKVTKNLTTICNEANENSVRERRLSGSSIASSTDETVQQETCMNPVHPVDEEHLPHKRRRVE